MISIKEESKKIDTLKIESRRVTIQKETNWEFIEHFHTIFQSKGMINEQRFVKDMYIDLFLKRFPSNKK